MSNSETLHDARARATHLLDVQLQLAHATAVSQPLQLEQLLLQALLRCAKSPHEPVFARAHARIVVLDVGTALPERGMPVGV